ncbi:MAG TPA: HEPN domain-containing protein [Anaerolineales bacterium]|nr:HEPN domain-containing protein [Anaerolineales bacterium]
MKEETLALLEKAERSIRNAEKTMVDGDLDFAASRAYYGMFYVAEALLGEKDLKFSKHGGVHGAFSHHFINTGYFDTKYQHWLVSAFNQRMLGDYAVTPEFANEDIQEIISQAREFLVAANKYLNVK